MNHRNVRIVAQHLLSDNWYLLKKIDFEHGSAPPYLKRLMPCDLGFEKSVQQGS